MTIPATYSITIYQGDSYSLLLRIKARDENGVMQYQDLTSTTPKAQIRLTAASNTVLAEFDADVTDQVALRGGVLLVLSPTQTAALTDPVMVWDCEVTYPDATKKTFLAGPVNLIKQVTR